MTDTEIAQLDMLLGKLVGFIGQKICIIPHSIFDGTQIGVYHESGVLINSAVAPTLKEAIEKLKV